jgi:hypothetical protein
MLQGNERAVVYRLLALTPVLSPPYLRWPTAREARGAEQVKILLDKRAIKRAISMVG